MPTPVVKNMVPHSHLLRDVRPVSVRMAEILLNSDMVGILFCIYGLFLIFSPVGLFTSDLVLMLALLQWWRMVKRGTKLSFKLPAYAKKMKDPNNPVPGKGGAGKPEGILFIGKDQENGDELWLSNNDARTHILYLGTTGAGKTEGLKSMVANALCWGSGFAFTDGKADTDLWASLYALARRFGRDDDLLVLNYMTGNTDDGAVSNTMNPFSNGSASYLTQMIVSLMPDAGGDNAMWKERAVALMSALMPALTWKRDKQSLLLDVGVVRDHLELSPIIRLSRDRDLPERIIRGIQGYLQTLPGYVDEAFDDEGSEKPPSPDQPMYDLQVARQQHGYLSMQFTRSLQSLADEYGYIFKAQLADIDVLDVVLNRRILVVLIPALEKSSDEAANLGKIVAASLKGMMGATLGNSVEGTWETAIETKQTRSSSSFMAVFDEVGYYTAQGMAVMAAQARSLGFSLVFAAQDLPAMEKRIRQEARSILGNCNLKIFGKIEDPTDTKDFLDKHVGTEYVYEATGFNAPTDTVSSLFFTTPFYDRRDAALTVRPRISYDYLRKLNEGQAYMFFGNQLSEARLFHAVPPRVKALRVHRFLPVPSFTTSTQARDKAVNDMAAKLRDAQWAAAAGPTAPPAGEIGVLASAVAAQRSQYNGDLLKVGIASLVKFIRTAPLAPAVMEGAAGMTAQQAAVPVKTGGSISAVTIDRAPSGLRAGDELAVGADGKEFAEEIRVNGVVKPAADKRPGLIAADVLSVEPLPGEHEDVDLTLPESMMLLAQSAAKNLREGLFTGRGGDAAE